LRDKPGSYTNGPKSQGRSLDHQLIGGEDERYAISPMLCPWNGRLKERCGLNIQLQMDWITAQEVAAQPARCRYWSMWCSAPATSPCHPWQSSWGTWWPRKPYPG